MPRVHIDPDKLRAEPEAEFVGNDAEFQYTQWDGHSKWGGRPKFEPEEWQRDLARKGTAYGLGIVDIATLLGISDATVERYLMEEIKLGRTQRNLRAVRKLWWHIDNGNADMLKFFMRVQMRWIEPRELAATAAADDVATMTDEQLQNEIDALSAAQGVASQARELATRLPR